MKDRTEQEHFDPVEDTDVHDASRPDGGECHRYGKHGSVQEQTMIEQVLSSANLRAAW